MQNYETKNISSAEANSTVVIRTKGNGEGVLGYITVLKDTAHTVAFYDGIDNTGTLLFTKPVSLTPGTYWFKRPCKKGIAAVVAASFAGELVVGYK